MYAILADMGVMLPAKEFFDLHPNLEQLPHKTQSPMPLNLWLVGLGAFRLDSEDSSGLGVSGEVVGIVPDTSRKMVGTQR